MVPADRAAPATLPAIAIARQTHTRRRNRHRRFLTPSGLAAGAGSEAKAVVTRGVPIDRCCGVTRRASYRRPLRGRDAGEGDRRGRSISESGQPAVASFSDCALAAARDAL